MLFEQIAANKRKTIFYYSWLFHFRSYGWRCYRYNCLE